MTHDQTFPGPSGSSVNLRVQKDVLPLCMYSFVLSQMLHYIVSVCQRFPSTKIYICKYDIDSAYRQCHLSATSAHEGLTIYNNMLLMALCMAFGGAPCPSLWRLISDTIADTCNFLVHNPLRNHLSLFDTLSNSIGGPISLPDSNRFATAQELAVAIPVNNLGKVDLYVYDIIRVALDLHNSVMRVHSFAHPSDSSELTP
jgi:hypothetical protein